MKQSMILRRYLRVLVLVSVLHVLLILPSSQASAKDPQDGGRHRIESSNRSLRHKQVVIQSDRACYPGWNDSCQDNVEYRSKMGTTCKIIGRANVDCTGFGVLGFTVEEVDQLIKSCPCACGIPCTAAAVPRTPLILPPTPSPSAAPSALPTRAPTTAAAPSALPTRAPTTAAPSALPTRAPTTAAPSAVPTTQPTTSVATIVKRTGRLGGDVVHDADENVEEEGSCFPGWGSQCRDNPFYSGRMNIRCKNVAKGDFDCTQFGVMSFTDEEIKELIDACPCSCRIECGTWTEPTVLPLPVPNASPSSPTFAPSPNPTKSPSGKPSHVPSASLSGAPSTGMSVTPSIASSNSPSSAPSARPTKSPSAVTKSGSSSLAPTSHPESSPIRMPLATPTSSPTRMSSLHPTFQPSKPPSKSPTKDPTQRPIESPTAHTAAPFSVEGRASDLLDEEGDANLGGDNAEEKSVNEDEASGDIVNILGKSPFETPELATNNDAKLGGLDIVAARREFYPTSASRNTIKLPIFAYFVYPLLLLWFLW